MQDSGADGCHVRLVFPTKHIDVERPADTVAFLYSFGDEVAEDHHLDRIPGSAKQKTVEEGDKASSNEGNEKDIATEQRIA